jgi:hypothetical protein
MGSFNEGYEGVESADIVEIVGTWFLSCSWQSAWTCEDFFHWWRDVAAWGFSLEVGIVLW